MKLVSIRTWYGGPSCVLNLKNSAEETCALSCLEKNAKNVAIKQVIAEDMSLHLDEVGVRLLFDLLLGISGFHSPAA